MGLACMHATVIVLPSVCALYATYVDALVDYVCNCSSRDTHGGEGGVGCAVSEADHCNVRYKVRPCKRRFITSGTADHMRCRRLHVPGQWVFTVVTSTPGVAG
jgi:hypothetical protein